jgi:cyclopropane fatty-acyl-phospholipid synthase-like methyltransferase
MGAPYASLARAYDALMYDADYPAWAGYIEALLEKNGVKRASRVLDAACGTGSLSILLHKAGYNMTALDISGDMLNEAARKFREAGANIPVVQQDLREIALHKKADAIVSACDGVNYLLSDADTAAFFTSAYANLRDGGLLLFDVSTAYKLKEVVGDNVFCDETEDFAYIWKNSFKDGFSHMELTLFIREGACFTRHAESHVQKAHDLETLKRGLAEAGFSKTDVFAFPTEGAASAKTERAQFVARK